VRPAVDGDDGPVADRDDVIEASFQVIVHAARGRVRVEGARRNRQQLPGLGVEHNPIALHAEKNIGADAAAIAGQDDPPHGELALVEVGESAPVPAGARRLAGVLERRVSELENNAALHDRHRDLDGLLLPFLLARGAGLRVVGRFIRHRRCGQLGGLARGGRGDRLIGNGVLVVAHPETVRGAQVVEPVHDLALCLALGVEPLGLRDELGQAAGPGGREHFASLRFAVRTSVGASTLFVVPFHDQIPRATVWVLFFSGGFSLDGATRACRRWSPRPSRGRGQGAFCEC
jgi:hypothetical protein